MLRARTRALMGALVLVVLPLLMLLPGCGGSGDSSLPGGNSIAGNYTSTLTISNGQTGILNLAVQSNGQLTGSFTTTISGGISGNVTVGVVGTANSDTAQFTASGTFTFNGTTYTVTVNGVLPVKGQNGAYTLVFNGQSFNGILTSGTNTTTTGGTTTGGTTTAGVTTGGVTTSGGTTTAGTTTSGTTTGGVTTGGVTTGGTTTGGTTTSGTTSGGTTGSNTLAFSNVSGTNATISNFTAQFVYTKLDAPSASNSNVGTLNIYVSPSTTDTSRALQYVVKEPGGSITAGKTYPVSLSGGATSAGAIGAFAVFPNFPSSNGVLTWAATGGNIVIDSINGKTVTFHVVNGTFTGAQPGQAGGAISTGSFTLNFAGTSTFAQ